jgi:hypothetical protein
VKKLLAKIKSIFKRKYEPEEPMYIVQQYFDTVTNQYFIVDVVCVCGWTVAYHDTGEAGYYCEHCDRICEEGLPICEFCQTLVSIDVEAKRAEAEQEERDRDQD